MLGNEKPDLRLLSQCLSSQNQLKDLLELLKRVDRCTQAVNSGLNLGDVVGDSKNRASLLSSLGSQFDLGMQIILKVALGNHRSLSFTLSKPIDGDRKLDFLYRSMGNWKQFDIVLSCLIPELDPSEAYFVLNPSSKAQWMALQQLPRDTVITVYLKGKRSEVNAEEESIALDRIETIFETVQNIAEKEMDAAVVMGARPITNGNGHRATPAAKKAPAPVRKITQPSVARSIRRSSFSAKVGGKLSDTLRVVINKMDTFVHAGNAQLIMNHVKDYAGSVKMYVLRGEKKAVQMDPDSIWGMEIRNGETVEFEFYGPKPAPDFVKELARKVNKYTQMDKMAG